MSTNHFDVLRQINQLIQENKILKQAEAIQRSRLYKSAAQPPMAGGAPMDAGGGMPPMGGGMPVDPNTGMPIDPNTGMPIDPNTGMPIDPSMMGGAPAPGMPPTAPPPAPPAPAEEAPADPAAAAAPKKLKPDEYMAKLDTRYYNLQILVTAIAKKLGVELPPEALITPTIDQEQNLNIDNPTPQIMDLGNTPDAPPAEEVPPEMMTAMGGAPDMGGETPKTASYRRGTEKRASQDIINKLRYLYKIS